MLSCANNSFNKIIGAKNQETIFFFFTLNTSLTIYESEGMTGLW